MVALAVDQVQVGYTQTRPKKFTHEYSIPIPD